MCTVAPGKHDAKKLILQISNVFLKQMVTENTLVVNISNIMKSLHISIIVLFSTIDLFGFCFAKKKKCDGL